ncbi:uncharacterized protein LOC105922717 [Fundulus heteroclitus]|uniref:uncharacterized protein LOC105922717 n=1 Tax=Fundulus heteroclitus TaxID=8078 RepID=UPI00165AFE46|nr:uncharacterized protein LOC105922717 [Fundulus heteroclitus]
MLVVFGILLHISQHALAGVVEVYEGAESVLLPCQYSGIIPDEDLSVLWTLNDINLKVVHLRREQGDDYKDQDQHYRGRTSMRPDALATRDFSLTLRKPHLSDSRNYICSIADGIQELKLTQVQLKVKDNQIEVKVNEKAESVVLPCETSADLKEDTVVEWTRSEPYFSLVHVFPNTSKLHTKQDNLYCSRTEMNVDLLRTGDLSLTLKYPTDRDEGSYICTVYRDEDILRQKVVLLHVKEGPFPKWATGLLICVVLLVVVVGGCFFLFWYYRRTVNVTVESGEPSVLLPCWYLPDLHQDVEVEWTDSHNKIVYVHKNGHGGSKEQDIAYKGRTAMVEGRMKFGDFSLTLKYPSDRDRQTYTCTISRKGKNLMKKRVILDVKDTNTCTVYTKEGEILRRKEFVLHVRVPEVVVDAGAEFVKLPFKTKEMPTCEDIEVEWMNSRDRRVHRFHHGSDHHEDQFCSYRCRTELNKDRIRTGDFSLTLKYPTDWDSDVYICKVYRKDGTILTKKRVALNVRGCWVEKQEGLIQLPFKTSPDLLKDSTVQWSQVEPKYRIIHVVNSQNRSDQPEEPEEYRNRTTMNEDLLETGDLTLTIKDPTEDDLGKYTCVIFGKDNQIMQEKTVQVERKVQPEESERTPLISN